MNCPRGLHPRHHHVILPDHAWGRYKERCGHEIKAAQERRLRKGLERYLEYALNNAIAAGLALDHTGAAWLEIEPLLWATVRLGATGWVVSTITDWSEKEKEAG